MMIAPMITDPYDYCEHERNEHHHNHRHQHNEPHHHNHHPVGNNISDEEVEDSDVDDDDDEYPKDDSCGLALCAKSERCVSSCAAYGRVCPASARSAAKAVHDKISKLTDGSKLFQNGPPDFEKFTSNDIAMGVKLGEGGFSFVNSCVIKKKKKINQLEDTNGTDDDVDEEAEGKEEMKTATTPTPRPTTVCYKEDAYAVKYLKRKIMVDLRHFRHGAADLATEAFFLGILDHPNIVKLHGVTAGSCESNVASGKDGGFFIVVDRLHETLDHRIVKWKKEVEAQPHSLFHRLSKDYKDKQKAMLCNRLQVALDITIAMDYLHNLNVAYRDLKPDNVGFSKDATLKIFDFGLAKEEKAMDGDDYGTYKMTGQTGSRRYMAPEVALDKPYNKSVDVYSFGILLWEMCCLQKPFAGYTSKRHMAHVVLAGERPSLDSSVAHHWPTKLQLLMKRCWSANHELRPTFGEIKIELAQIIDECTVTGADKVGKHHHATSETIKPPIGGFASMKPMMKADQSRGHTIGTIPTSPKPSERRHWSFGFVLRNHHANQGT